MSNLWDDLTLINKELRPQFICVPPYQSVNGKFIYRIKRQLDTGSISLNEIYGKIGNPFQRAYQKVYRYEQCSIFTPYLPAIESATYEVMGGNGICAYLTLLPIVEAILRKWAEQEPTISFRRMKDFAPELIAYLHTKDYYPDDRINWIDSHIDFLKYILEDVLYISFKDYNDKKFSSIFNRNLALHKMQGTANFLESQLNALRILLILDIIAELYLMQEPSKYWNVTFYANPENNLKFQLHWKLYIKRVMLALSANELQIALTELSDDVRKHYINVLDNQIALIKNLSENGSVMNHE